MIVVVASSFATHVEQSAVMFTARSLFNADDIGFMLDLSSEPNKESVTLAGCHAHNSPGQWHANVMLMWGG